MTRAGAALLVAALAVLPAVQAEPPRLPPSSEAPLLLPSFPIYRRALLAQMRTVPTRFPGTANPFRDLAVWGTLVDPEGRTHAMPVVCTAVSGSGASAVYTFSLHYMPDKAGIWSLTLQFFWPAQPQVNPFDFGLWGQPLPFSVEPDRSSRGPWRPAMAEGHPFALVRDTGAGGQEYVWSLSDLRFGLFARGWEGWAGGSAQREAVAWAAERGFNRIRAPLTAVFDRNMDPGAPFDPAAPSFTCFAKQPQATDYQPGSLDFERFDLDQWDTVDSVCAYALDLDVQISVLTTFNTGCFDYEEQYLGTSFNNRVPVSGATPSPFTFRDELYYWYVVGRLAAWPHVQWSLFQEQDLPGSCPPNVTYTADSVRRWGELFRAINPYLAADVNARIVTVCPRRGTLYVASGTQGYQLGPCTPVYLTPFSLCNNNSEFVSPVHDSWRSCIGLQRGGELGWGSVVDAASPPSGGCSQGPTTLAHRRALLAAGTPRPIFIEEDVLVRDTVNPGVSAAFRTTLNPYCYCLCKDATGACTLVNTGTVMPGISTNQDGLGKLWLDMAWLCGVMSQGYLTYAADGIDNLAEPRSSEAWRPLDAAASLMQNLPWWRLEACRSGEVGTPFSFQQQSLQQWAHEWTPRGAAIPGSWPPQMIVYRPYSTAAVPIPAWVTTVALGGSGAVVRFRYVHPISRGVFDPPAGHHVVTLLPGATWRIPEPPPSMQGPCGEYVVLVNL